MTLIQQRESADCVIAATAMFTGTDYETVLAAARAVGCYRKGRGISATCEILGEMGYVWDNVIPRPTGEGRRFQELYLPDFYLSPNVMRQMLWGRSAMMSVDSLNNDGGRHMIYYDGARVWDPQEGRRGKKWYTEYDRRVMPYRAYVWGPER